MPGHNHYASCTCGWCVQYARNRFRTSAALLSADLYSARRFLREHGVRRYISACFVNPNAKCPECGAQVFYYENAHGSRVFFDHLGPPWPKHPCTDRRSATTKVTAQCARPERRRRGLSLELLEAVQKVVAGFEGHQAPDDNEDGWVLLCVTAVERTGWRNRITSDLLGAEETTVVILAFDSSEEVVQLGDIVSFRDKTLSLFDLERMKPRTYKATIEDWRTAEAGSG